MSVAQGAMPWASPRVAEASAAAARRIVLAGGSGHLGSLLATAWSAAGHDVVVLSRHPAPAPRWVAWDGRTLGPWAAEVDGADVVVNLAGRSVNCRYDARNRREITSSRVDSTRVVGQAIAAAARPPAAWLQMSTATIYAHRHDAPNDEDRGILGGQEPGVPPAWRFSTDVCKAWEAALAEARTPLTRKVALRAAIVLAPGDGGPFDLLLRVVRLGLGGRAGDGRQYVSWIHGDDFVRAVDWLSTHPGVEGAVNVAAPHALPNAEFMRALREAWGIRIGLPAARWMVTLGAAALRTEPELLLKSRRVVPARLLREGFAFLHPSWPEAARDLCARWRTAH